MGNTTGKAVAPYRRRAHHAGSWYAKEPQALQATLTQYLQQATTSSTSSSTAAATTVRAILCPHAGYSYSGPTAAYSYSALQTELQQRAAAAAAANNSASTTTTTIIVLHPSHHVYLQGCAVSGAVVLETPVGDLPVNDAVRQELLQTGLFTIMTAEEDEHEHSGEMQYPYLAQIIRNCNISIGKNVVTVLPIMCGALQAGAEARYGQILAPLLARPDVITVISTDFCHWGKRFAYQPVPPTKGSATSSIPIHQFIQQMDQRGMDLIAMDWRRPGAFADYLRQTRNTICGRHAVAVWLQALAATYPATAAVQPKITFVKYAQSSAAQSMADSSVSYAAAVCTLE